MVDLVLKTYESAHRREQNSGCDREADFLGERGEVGEDVNEHFKVVDSQGGAGFNYFIYI